MYCLKEERGVVFSLNLPHGTDSADPKERVLLHPEGLRMNGDGIEPRTVLWARAEVCWVDATGTPHRVSATMEDSSPSGACVRTGDEIEVGSKLTVKRHGEQFSGIARNRRREGYEFLVGIQRSKLPGEAAATAPAKDQGAAARAGALPSAVAVEKISPERPSNLVAPVRSPKAPAAKAPDLSSTKAATPRPESPTEPVSPHHERNVMQPTPLLRKLWPRQLEPDSAPDNAIPAEVPVNKSDVNIPESLPEPKCALLSCEDIYRASGILGARSKYDINKIVEMLNSKHIRELPKEVRRASVLMALDAAGTTVDEILNDAARRQHALNSYEGGQQKEFEQFEAGKVRENAQIKLEMERVAAHYADRIQRNLDHVAQEKEAFRTWQAAKEQESQRISEAVGLCSKQAVAETSHDASPVLAKSAAATGSAAAGPKNDATGLSH